MNLRYYFALAVMLVLVLWILIPYLITTYVIPGGSTSLWPIRGQFGDMFGAVNALFSGLALTAIAFTVYLQYRDLKAQGKILAKQSELVEYHLDREKHLARPYIAGIPVSNSNSDKTIKVVNYGERIININIKLIEPKSGITISPKKIHRLRTDEDFDLKISGYRNNQCPGVKIEFSFVNYLGEKDALVFYVPKGSSQELANVYDCSNLSSPQK